MDRLEGMRVFVAVAESRGFAPAARQLGLSPPAVTRAIAAIEQHVGAQLLRRTTRSVSLTAPGQRYLDDCKRILADIAEAEAAAGGAYSEPQGLLSITASAMFGRLHLAPVLLDFLAAHPQVSARTWFDDHIVHLLDAGFDVAVRIAQLSDSGLRAVPVGHVRRVIVASPAYLAEHGVPRSPADVARHAAIGFSQHGAVNVPWSFHLPGGKGRVGGDPVQPRMQLVANTGEMSIAAALAGHGLTRAVSYQVADDVLAGRLRIVLADHEAPPVPVQLVHVEGRRVTAKLRAFIDFSVARLRQEPVLNGQFRWPDPA